MVCSQNLRLSNSALSFINSKLFLSIFDIKDERESLHLEHKSLSFSASISQDKSSQELLFVIIVGGTWMQFVSSCSLDFKVD